MAKQASIKPQDIEKYANLNLHELEEVIEKLSNSAHPSAKADLRAARQALSNRQRVIKSKVMEFEQFNDHRLLFFDSTSGFSKLAGHSVLFFSMTIADRIHWRYSVKVDTDHYSVSEDGTISFRSLEGLNELLAAINIFPDPERSDAEFHYYKLAKVYTEEQIAKLRDNSQRDAERISAIILPKSPLPLLYDAISQVDRTIYYQFKHISDQLARETVGRRMIMESYELMIQYLEYARVDNPNPNANLAKMIELTRRLRDGMAYVNRLQLMHHREICQTLENLVLIDRITSKTYSKAVQATKR